MSPHGTVWNNLEAKKMAQDICDDRDFIFICGRYEGIDQRFIDLYVDQEISLGDFVLSCGDWALLSILDSMLRFIDGVVGVKESVQNDSFEDGLLDHPHYTKPQIFEGVSVPSVLVSGNHHKIKLWRENKKLELTKSLRPDLFKEKNE